MTARKDGITPPRYRRLTRYAADLVSVAIPGTFVTTIPSLGIRGHLVGRFNTDTVIEYLCVDGLFRL
jgi:hypothetical protein